MGIGEFDRLRIAALFGLIFSLRASEMTALAETDMTFGEHNGKRYVRIFIRDLKRAKKKLGRAEVLTE